MASASSALLIILMLAVINRGTCDESQALDPYSFPNEEDLLQDATAIHRISGRSGGGEEQPGAANTSQKDNSNCHALPSEIHVTKEEADESGNVVRVCEGTIRVAKCEGTCLSELRPSVHSPTGFAKVIVSSN